MCGPEERKKTRDEKKLLIKAMDDYVDARVAAVLKAHNIKGRCSECGREKEQLSLNGKVRTSCNAEECELSCDKPERMGYK